MLLIPTDLLLSRMFLRRLPVLTFIHVKLCYSCNFAKLQQRRFHAHGFKAGALKTQDQKMQRGICRIGNCRT